METITVVQLPVGFGPQREPVRVDEKGVVFLSPELVKMLIGGEWPNFHGFDFKGSVHSYQLDHGLLIPMASEGEDDVAPGPNFELRPYMVDDVFRHPPKFTKLPQKKRRRRKNQ